MSFSPQSMSLDEIVLAARQHADQVSSGFLTTQEWQFNVNQSLFSRYDKMIAAYGNDYFVADPYTFSTDGTNGTFALPSDFYKLLGVDCIVNGNTQAPITLKPFPFQERNQGNWPGLIPPAGLQIRLFYVPKMIPLTSPNTITLDGVVDGDSLVINGVTFTCVSAAPAANQFVQGATDTATASNLASCIAASTSTAVDDIVTATSDGAVVTVTQLTDATVTWSTTYSTYTFSPNQSEWTARAQSYSGWLEYVIVDAAIKALVKEESDPSALMAQEQALLKRLEAMASNRDAGEPSTVADAYAVGGLWTGGLATPYGAVPRYRLRADSIWLIMNQSYGNSGGWL